MPGADDLELRMDDLEAEVALAHLAEHAHAPARRERLLLARIEVEEAQHELRARAAHGVFVLEQADELTSRPVLDVGVDDGPFGLLLCAGAQLGERHEARVILVAQRQVQDEVLVADEAEPHELIVEPARWWPIGGWLRGLGHGAGRGTTGPIIVGFGLIRRVSPSSELCWRGRAPSRQ